MSTTKSLVPQVGRSQPNKASLAALARRNRKSAWVLRLLLATGVIATGTWANLRLGLEIENALYQAIRQLAFAAEFYPAPAIADAEPIAYRCMWALRLLAPLLLGDAIFRYVTTTSPMRALANAFEPPVVILGAGKLGTMVCEELTSRSGFWPWTWTSVIVIERDPKNANLDGLRALGVRIVIGDGAQESTLRRARAHRARWFLAFAGDDIANVNATLRALQLQPRPELWCLCHVYDLELERTLDEYIADTGWRDRVDFVNSYRLAASRVVEDRVLGLIDGGAAAGLVIIGGFGRFGQSVAEALASTVRETKGLRLLVIDKGKGKGDGHELDEKVGEMRSRLRLSEKQLQLKLGSIEGNVIRESIAALQHQLDPTPLGASILILCTDDDVRNLAIGANCARPDGPAPHADQLRVQVVTRMFQGIPVPTLRGDAGRLFSTIGQVRIRDILRERYEENSGGLIPPP